MLCSCGCLQKAGGGGKRRSSSSVEDASSSRMSELESNSRPQTTEAASTRTSSLLQLFHRKGPKCFRKPQRPKSPMQAEKTIRAAIFIQKWYRQHQARQEMRKRCNWQIFQNLEYASEQDQAELYKFFHELIKHMPQAAGTGNKSPTSTCTTLLEESEALMEEVGDIVSTKVEIPIMKSHIDLLIDVFRKKRSNRLHPKYVVLILREAAKSLKEMPNLSMVSTAVSQQVTVCGDLHGKLDDLLVVLCKNGLPSTSNPYVFNGDFVDRGKKGLEVLLLLLSLYLAFPNAVFLNRGNHEDSVMNARYGFSREVERKYPRNYKRLLRLIDEVYRWLPLGSIINNRVLIVHGGFSDNTDLDLIKTIDRSKYVSILRPPLTEGQPLDKAEWQQIFDIMWSDPQSVPGCIPNTLRGAGVWFGPDTTEKFLERHRLSYMIRSHECKPNGHEFTHDNKVITIFSASNYYALGSNKGAYIRLNNQLVPRFVQYISAASQAKKLTFKQRVGIVESAALKELAVKMREYRDELETEFKKYDPDDKGYITISKWCYVMEKVTKLGLPWRLLREKLAPGTDSKSVNYFRTLDLLDTDVILEAEADGTSVMDALYANKTSLETIFNIIDADKSGEITLDEFEKAIDLLDAHMPGDTSKSEMLEKCRMMDLNGDGKVDLNEFLEAFRLSDIHRKQQQEADIRKRSTTRSSINQPPSDSVTKLANIISKNTLIIEQDIDPMDCESKIIEPTK
ncbi:serine/threonine-protein phosphatase rdgC isoform X1 [Drosophila nasuta]|uniref:serine/threonine-protein phosphatase rdgC isoform X1 n=1 Tax=Drosophila nasuta TaxID=42062 RepID=UPI00295EE4A0|nr:serine/threonine-protein phosphatase rdgC isoform X1 [Drosophila nasuta]XP_060656998.1 serine/threonine-protein phosphatase rdgC isoform X1 [Drosophila nasuta]XP_060656999.1 serine/threonine-protein phosphatase rdgC isoform X1 [Drosophila nasuta]